MHMLFAPGRWLVGLIREKPGQAVLVCIAVHFFLWTLFPSILFGAAPLDVVEGYLWGQEWQLGYHKHPPLAPWLLEAFREFLGGDWSSYLLGQLCVIIAYGALWVLAKPMVGAPAAALSILALELVFYFTAPTLEFNPNVLQIPLWALAILHFHRALTKGRWSDHLFLAIWMALLVYTKYSAIILALAFAVVVLATPTGRRALVSPKLYLATLLSALLAAPHLYWIVDSAYLPFTYALDQKAATDIATRLYYPANFLAAQIACHLVLFLVAGLIFLGNRLAPANACPRIEVQEASRFDHSFVFIMALAPLVISVLLCFLMGIEFLTMWGTPMFTLSGLALILLVGRPFRLRFASRLATLYLAFIVLLPVGLSIGMAVLPAMKDRATRTMWPGEYHASLVAGQFERETGQPLRILAGDIWVAGLVSLYDERRPSVLIEGDFRRSPWIDRDRLAETGLAIVWRVRWGNAEPPAWVQEGFPDRKDLGLFDLPPSDTIFGRLGPHPYATIGISVVPPQERQSASAGGFSGISGSTAQ